MLPWNERNNSEWTLALLPVVTGFPSRPLVITQLAGLADNTTLERGHSVFGENLSGPQKVSDSHRDCPIGANHESRHFLLVYNQKFPLDWYWGLFLNLSKHSYMCLGKSNSEKSSTLKGCKYSYRTLEKRRLTQILCLFPSSIFCNRRKTLSLPETNKEMQIKLHTRSTMYSPVF